MKINIKNISWILFVIILIVFLFVIKDKITNYSLNSDENVYFYMAKMISEGNSPYKDFFFAHPPVHIYISAIIFKIFGFNFVALKLIPVIAVLISALFIFKLVREKFDNTKALLAIVLFLFQYNLLRVSTQSAGINLTLMFIVIATYYLFKENYLVSGIFAGIAGITGIYSLIMPGVILIYLFFSRNRKKLIRFLTGFCVIFLVVNFLFLIAYGKDFFVPVYQYHLQKPETEITPFYRFSIFSVVFQLNILLFLSSILIFFTKNWKRLKPIIFISLAYLVFLVSLPKAFIFYYVLVFPFLSILGSIGFIEIIKKYKTPNKYSVIFVMLLILLTISFSVTNFRSDYIKYDKNKIDEMAEFVKENSDENDLIFGDIYIVPLLALITGRDIALNMADANAMRFKSGITDINETIEKLKEEKPKFVIIHSKRDLAYMESFVVNFLKTDCRLLTKMEGKNFGEYFIFDCKNEKG